MTDLVTTTINTNIVTAEEMLHGNNTANLTTNSTSIKISSGQVLVDRTLGSNIGDLTEAGGLASAFDGNTTQTSYGCAVKTGANSAYIGKTFAVPTIITKAIAYPSNNVGFVSSANVTLQLYGKTGSAPVNATNGTLLAESNSFLDVNKNGNSVLLVSNDHATFWNHGWVTILPSESASLRMAELEFYTEPADQFEATASGVRVGNTSVNSTTVSSTLLNVGTVNATSISLVNSTSNTSLVIPTSIIRATNNYVLHANGSWIEMTGARTTLETPVLAGSNVQGALSSIGTALTGRNRLYNGSMTVCQRNYGTTPGVFTAATYWTNGIGSYTLDRWMTMGNGADTIDIFHEDTESGTLGGFYGILLRVATADRKFGICQILSDEDTYGLRGETVTLSFYAQAAHAKLDNVKAAILSWSGDAWSATYPISSWNAEDTNPTLVTGYTYENTPVNLGVNTNWARYSVTATLDTANIKSVTVMIWSDVTDTDVDNDLRITRVQLEPGSVATPFEWRHPATEMAMCYRFHHTYTYFMAFAGSTPYPGVIAQYTCLTPVQMYKTPSFGFGGSWNFSNCHSLNGIGFKESFYVYVTITAAGGFQFYTDANDSLYLDAEIY